MDIAAYSMIHAMQSSQTQASTAVLGKVMDQEKLNMDMMLADFAVANSSAQMLAPKLGSMNIRV